MAAGFDRNAFIQERRQFLGKCFGTAHVRHRDLCATMAQKQRGRSPGLAEPTTRTFFPFNSIQPT